MSVLLSRQQIIDVNDLNSEIVEVPEWGGSVKVIALNAKDAQAYAASLVKINNISGKVEKLNMDSMMTKLLVKAIVDEHGEPLFNEDEVEILNKKNSKPIKRLFEAAQRLSGIGDDKQQEIKENLD